MRPLRTAGPRARLAPLALAAAGALALGGAPALLGTGSAGDDPAELSQFEAGAHAYHADETVAGELRNEAVLERCETDPAYRAANWESCPASAGAALRTLAAADASDVGEWSAPTSVPSLAIHSVVLPTGKVLWFSRTPDNDGGTAHLYDPATGEAAAVPPPMVEHGNGQTLPANIWCGGQAQLPDGRVLVAGGNLAYPTGDGDPQEGHGYKGAAWILVFDPFTETWERLETPGGEPWDMVHGRWYPTLTTLSDGRVLIVGGWDERGYQNDVREVEVFTPRSAPGGRDRLDTVGSVPGHVNIYPHMFLLPKTTLAGQGAGDRVLLAGPGRGDAFLLHTEDWSWRALPRPRTSRFWGTAVMEPGGSRGPERVTLIGGADVEANPAAPQPTATSEYLDLNDAGWADQDDPSPTWRDGPSLDHARAHFNTVLLPDGSKLSSGGGLGQASDGSLYAGPVYEAELYDPAAGDWRPAGKEDDERTYHSTAVLLPDGRVLSAGDDRPDHLPQGGRTAQLYSPPYLAGAPDRPAVTGAPRAVGYGARLPISVGDPSAVARVVLMRPGAVTHAVDMDQRSIELARRAGEDGVVVTSPPDPSVAPPGWYMLFALDARGV
ncbi:MAG TPA: galactose oxidase-like domain-containing protein, partial [Miltoncostaeaceae bacterium]|nr:galactose oxidase-like domain-containing protein [Miltoncostaeaceae bacterium]